MKRDRVQLSEAYKFLTLKKQVMKIQLSELKTSNFRGDSSSYSFSDNTIVSGKNGSGKSRMFNAFCWCLFGKDASDRKDYNVRSIINGELVHDKECSVTLKMLVDDKEVIVKRSFCEDFSEIDGQKVFKGNHTECEYNGTPVKVGDYDKKIKGIIEADSFKLLTNPLFFANMEWKKQREILMSIVSCDDEISSLDSDFKDLISLVGNSNFDEIRKENQSKKRLIKKQLEEIEPKIEAINDVMPVVDEDMDIEKEEKEIKEKLEKSYSDMRSCNEANEAIKEKQKENVDKIISIRESLSEYKGKVVAEKNNKMEEAMNSVYEAQKELSDAKECFSDMKYKVSEKKAVCKRKESRIEELDKQLSELRAEYASNSSVEMSEDETKCPMCEQELPIDKIESKKNSFEINKKNYLEKIASKGKELAEEKKKEMASLEEMSASIEEDEKNLAIRELVVIAKENNLKNIGDIEKVEIDFTNDKEVKRMEKEISDLESLKFDDDKKYDNTKIDALNASMQEITEKKVALKNIESYNKTIEELKSKGREYMKQIASLDKIEEDFSNYMKRKISIIEKEVNSLFDKVSFKLYSYTIDGKAIETCDMFVDGVPFGVKNNAGKINAGLEVIDVLGKKFGVLAPVFIDNAESVNELRKISSQTIEMYVTKESKLTIIKK